MLIPLLLIAGLAVAAWDYDATHQAPPKNLQTRTESVQRTSCEYPCRGKVHTAPVNVVATKDEYGMLHMDVQEATEANAGIPIDQ